MSELSACDSSTKAQAEGEAKGEGYIGSCPAAFAGIAVLQRPT